MPSDLPRFSSMGWALHVAPVVDVIDDGLFLETVLDPVIAADGPLRLEGWKRRLNDDLCKLGQTSTKVYCELRAMM